MKVVPFAAGHESVGAAEAVDVVDVALEIVDTDKVDVMVGEELLIVVVEDDDAVAVLLCFKPPQTRVFVKAAPTTLFM